MFCEKCGAENKAGAKFCGKCGSELKNRFPETNIEKTENNKDINEYAYSRTIKMPVKLIAVVLIVVIVCIGGIKGFSIVRDNQEYARILSEADEYSQQRNFKEALASYHKAIDEFPQKEKAYVKCAELYAAYDMYDKAKTVLTTGENQASKGKIQRQAKEVLEKAELRGQYRAYIESEAAAEFGKLDIGKSSFKGVRDWIYGWMGDNTGIICEYMQDLNGDGTDELVMLYSYQVDVLGEDSYDWYYEGYYNGLAMRVYSLNGGDVVLADEVIINEPVDGIVCDINIYAGANDDKTLLVYYTNDASYHSSGDKKFCIFEFGDDGDLNVEMQLKDPGYSDGRGLFDEMKDLCLYESDYEGQISGVYESYNEAIIEEFKKHGVPVEVEDNDENLKFHVKADEYIQLLRITSQVSADGNHQEGTIERYNSIEVN